MRNAACFMCHRGYDTQVLTFICLRILHYRMTLRTAKSDRDVRTRSTAFRVDLGTRYVTICLVSHVAGRSGGKFSAIFLQPIQNRGLYRTEVAAIRVTCICVA
jgi:hypothetical protein